MEKNNFYRFSWYQFAIDCLFVFFSFFLSEELFAKEGFFFTLKPWQNLALYCVVVLTLPYYFGYLYVKFSNYYPKGVTIFFKWLFIIIVLSSLVYMFRMIGNMNGVEELRYDASGFFTIFAAFLIILGPMMSFGGFAAGQNDSDETPFENRKFDVANIEITGALMIIVMSIAFMIYLIGLFPKDSGAWVVVVAYLGGPILAIITFGLYLALMNFLSKIGLYKYLALFANYSFPFFIISVLIYWSGVSMNFNISDFTFYHRPSFGGLLFGTIITGLIPFRIIMMFSPPISFYNLAFGFLGISFLIFKIYSIC